MLLQSPRKKFFILGLPGVGKTTLIEYLYKYLKNNLPQFFTLGFITKEVREGSKRKGFKIEVLPFQQEYILAEDKKFLSFEDTLNRPSVGKYIVYTETLDITIEILKNSLNIKEPLFFIIDEIGKMEILSFKFCEFIKMILHSPHFLLATLGKGESSFLKEIKNFEPAFFCELTRENRNFLRNRLEYEFQRKGKIIAIEGIDGAGKTTLSKILYDKLKKEKIECILSAEPTDGPFGKKLKELLKKEKIDSLEFKQLILKDRKWHVEKLIIPSIKNGRWVILDRYYLSTIAYQGAQGLDEKTLLIENETIAPTPDLVIYLDLSIKEALKRINNRKKGIQIFEKKEFLTKVDAIYKKYLKWFNCLILEAESPLEENLKLIKEYLNSKFEGTFS